MTDAEIVALAAVFMDAYEKYMAALNPPKGSQCPTLMLGRQENDSMIVARDALFAALKERER